MDLSKLSDADLAALQSGDLTKLSDAGLAQLSGTPQKAPETPQDRTSWADKLNALATGFNQGLLRLAGLPVDTVANVIDLGKAAIGAPYTAITGKPAPEMLQLRDRAEVAGSGENLIRATPEKMVRAQNPDYEGGYLQAAGSALPTLAVPGSGKAALAQTATNVAGALAGKFVGEKTGSVPLAVLASMGPAIAAAPRIKPVETQKAKTLRAAQAEGYVTPPSQAGAGWLNARLESVAGKAALNQDALARNQEVTNRVALRGTKLPAGEQATHEGLARLRADAGRLGYAPIDQIGEMQITPGYVGKIKDIENQYGNQDSRVSSLRFPRVNELASELTSGNMTGAEANRLIKQLRESGNQTANAPYGSDQGSQALGKAQLASSKAIEGLIDDHLLQFGPSNVVPQLRASRQEIAQLHTLEKALNPGTGDVNAQVFAQRMNAGKPLSGDQELIAKFAKAYPQLTKPSAGAPTPGVSAIEAFAVPIASALGHGATGNASGLLAGGVPLLRSPVRNLLLSKWYQQQFAKDPSKLGKMTPEQLGALSQMLLSTGVLEQQEE